MLDGVDLDVRRGEIVALEGPNGSGKTTLARIAAGLLEPQAGTVEVRGRAGYLSQDPGRYLVRETALEEVALAVNRDEQRARAALERVGLGWAAARHPRDLSSGERERLALAAVAVAEPDVLILDEPTRGVDPERKARLGAWLEEYAASGKAVVVATHDRELPAHRADRTLCFRNTSGSSRECALAPRVAAGRSAAALALAAWAALDPARGGVATLLAAVAVLVAGFAWLEGGTVSARDLTLVATLGGLAAAGRVLFAPIPSVQPVTVIVAASGVALGPRRGFAVGALAAIASNFFLGQGPHTPWQMLALGRLRPARRPRPDAAAAPARLRGVHAPARLRLRNADGPLALARLLPAHRGGAASPGSPRVFPFNVAHAAGNVILALVAGPELRRVLERYERQSRTEVVWA